MGELVIAVDDPGADDVRALLARHLAFAYEHTPVANVHALDLDELVDATVTFFSARCGRDLVAIGALKQLDETHGELKSMHTVDTSRGQGFGRAMVDHLVDVARQRGYRRVSLETGTMDAFAPARALYARAGFVVCAPFGDYSRTPDNTFMTLPLS